MAVTLGTPITRAKPPKANAWLKALITGLVLYVLSVGILFLTSNPNLFPTVVMIGSFLVPITYVTFFYERRHLASITLSTTVIGFIFGGILGVLAASLLEPIFIRKLDFASAISIGLIEEFAKIIGVFIIARSRNHDSEMDGLIIGAAAGMGFAALESMGYTFTAFLSSGGSLSATVVVTLVRGILSPIGHGTWTAILASVIFRESKLGHFHINYKVIIAYLIVSVLHGLWDGVPMVISSYVSSGLDVFLGQAVIGVAGLLILRMRWREANRLELEEAELAKAATLSEESAATPEVTTEGSEVSSAPVVSPESSTDTAKESAVTETPGETQGSEGPPAPIN